MLEFPFHQSLTSERRAPGVEAAVVEEAPQKEVVTGRATQRKRRVLVMDDEASILDLTGRMLQSQGYEVELTADGETAVSLYRAALEAGRRFDVVILDLTVPAGMGGYDTFSAMRGIDPGVKVIVSSGYSHEPVVLRYKELGIAGLAPKPYKLSELLAAVAGVLAAC